MLRENLDSVLRQDFADYEVIYVDDGSTDETPAILEEYSNSHPDRLRVLRVPNGGQGLARNAGAREAGGQFLLFTDDDTIAPPDWISRMTALYGGHACDALTGGFTPFSMQNRIERYMYYRECILCGDKPGYVRAAPTMSFLIPRDLFWELGGFIAEPIEDWAFCRRLHAAGKRLYYDPAVRVTHHYQTTWPQAMRRIRTPAIRGLYDWIDNGGSGLAYLAYTAINFAASPLWIMRYFPLDLYATAFWMEARFFAWRARAYLVNLFGRRLHTPH